MASSRFTYALRCLRLAWDNRVYGWRTSIALAWSVFTARPVEDSPTHATKGGE